MKIKKNGIILTLSLCLLNPMNSSAITVMDKNVNYDSLELKNTNGIEMMGELIESEKVIIRQGEQRKEIHLFDFNSKTNESIYRKTYIQKGGILLSTNVGDFKNEGNIYKNAGFPGLPDLHITNLDTSDIFVDQSLTGKSSSSNCGPAVLEMTEKWLNPNSSVTTKGIREEVKPEGGWIYTSDIDAYLIKRGIKSLRTGEINEDVLTNTIDNGNVSILCIEAGRVPFNSSSDLRIGRFYSYDSGHFVLLTGYLKFGDSVYFEILDSNTWGKTIKDGIPAGKGRYIKSEDLLNASKNWWDNSIEIIKQKNPGTI